MGITWRGPIRRANSTAAVDDVHGAIRGRASIGAVCAGWWLSPGWVRTFLDGEAAVGWLCSGRHRFVEHVLGRDAGWDIGGRGDALALEQLRHCRIGVDGQIGATVDQPADELGVDVVAVLVGDQHPV